MLKTNLTFGRHLSQSLWGGWILAGVRRNASGSQGIPGCWLQVFLVCLPGTWSHFQVTLSGKPVLWWLSQPAAMINQLSVPAVQLLFVSLTLSTGVGQSLTQNPSPQAEQQLVDCAQAFNNHGCSG